ncbi:MAG: tRNA (adenosine(37)-N6)-dimethylallyltransferase MiaA [Clostridiales bacterium]|nr:tRNA (adenosine(37)-N6)-dimethylallyltransferase MiaA [Candidatus Crickella merdequi]
MNKLVVITGTNASGKSGLGIELAKHYGAEIVSADSRQVFKGLDLGSGKVTPEEMQGIPHYLIDVAEPNDFFSLLDFQTQAYEAIDNIIERGITPMLVGGTGLYINSVVDGYDIRIENLDPSVRKKVSAMSLEELIDFVRENNPAELENIDIKNKRRLERAAERTIAGIPDRKPNSPRYETLVIGVTWPRDVLYERIHERLDRRLDQGMIEEVEGLKANGATDEFLNGLGLEYRYINMYLNGQFKDFDAFYDKLYMEIRHLAKAQMTWFRKRNDIKWIDMQDKPFDEAKKLIDDFLAE